MITKYYGSTKNVSQIFMLCSKFNIETIILPVSIGSMKKLYLLMSYQKNFYLYSDMRKAWLEGLFIGLVLSLGFSKTKSVKCSIKINETILSRLLKMILICE